MRDAMDPDAQYYWDGPSVVDLNGVKTFGCFGLSLWSIGR